MVLRSVLKALLLGLAAPVVSAIIAFFTFSDGVSVNTDAWPPAAKAVLAEQPGQPRTSEQWRRIERELQNHAGQPRFSHLLAAEFRQAWLVFAGGALVAAVLVFAFMRRLNRLGLASAVLVATLPTVFVLWGVFSHTHPYY